MFGLEIIIILIVSLVAGAVRSARKKKEVSRDLDGWAQALGMVRIGDELFGEMEGVPVGARLAFDGPHGTKVAARWTLFARIQPPLDLGLVICHRNRGVEVPGGGEMLAWGNSPAFDARFETRCDEPARALKLLNRHIRNMMLKWIHPDAIVTVADGGVAVQSPHESTDLETLRHGLLTVAGLVNGLNAARDHVPAASVLVGHCVAWRQFSKQNGLSHIAAPLCMFGSLLGSTMYAYSVRKAPGDYDLDVWMRFEEPLGLGLLVQPMRTVDRMKELFGAQDYKLGDPLFDETFLVRVSDEAGTVALLDADTQKRLLVIHDTVGPLSLTDDGLSIRLPHVPPDPTVVPRIAQQMLEIAHFVSNKRAGQRHGPYR